MEQFASWELIGTFAGLVTFTFAWVQATKEYGKLNDIPTDLYAWIVAFVLVVLSNLHAVQVWDTQAVIALLWDIPMYVFTALFVSMSGGKLSTMKPIQKKVKEVKVEDVEGL